jgi:PAS domain S-box
MRKTKRPDEKAGMLKPTSLRQIIDNAHDGIVVADNSGKIRFVSPALAKSLRQSPRQMQNKSIDDLFHPDELTTIRKHFRSVQKPAAKDIRGLHRVRRGKNQFIAKEVRFTNYLQLPGVDGIAIALRDPAKADNLEPQSASADTILRIVNKDISEGVFLTDAEGRFTYANESFLRMTGYATSDELFKVRLQKVFPEKSLGFTLTESLHAGELPGNLEVRFSRKTGRPFHGLLNTRVVGRGGNIIAGTLRDITREKVMEEDLSAAQNLFNNIINTVAAPIFIKDSRHRWIICNDSFCKLAGKPRDTILGKSDPDFFPPEEAKLFWKADNETLKTGRTVVQEEKLTLNGKVSYLLTVKSRYINEKGERFIIGFLTDITHLRKVQEEIQHLHENLQGVLESSKESIFSVDKNLRYVAFNKRHREIMRILYGAKISVGADKIKFFKKHPDAKWVKAELMKALNGHHFVSDHYQEFENYKGHIQATYNPIRGEDKKVKGVAVFVQDVTQRKRYEQIINSINASLRSVMESTSDGIVALDRQFQVNLFNKSFAMGLRKMLQTDISKGDDIRKALPPEIRRKVRAQLAKAFSGERLTVEQQFPDGDILEMFYNPVVDDEGKVTGAAVFIRNITEKKRIEEHNRMLNRELKDQNAQLARQESELKSALKELSDRNYELDQLMYKTSHDLRSPLSSIIGLINLANLDNDPNTFPEYLSKIENRAKKLDEFIRSMLDYARVNRVDRDVETVSLPELIHNCISELEYMDNKHKLRTDLKIDAGATEIQSDRLRLKIIFSNIISNAVKYMNPEADSYLEIQANPVDRGVHLTFTDNGIGIREEHVAKIFNMFYRATERSQGSGLGMYIVKQAVEKLGGSISLSSEYGKGTRIKIILPEK